ncbi:hypothetical protein AWB79_02793 [Caballeronia hypogeia]|jgi:hypothetical protein|uniref:Uncharacterized protein n=2 Tax=Caballeronia hypogeia TaxID=1777140 RepID=A0A158ATR2_9BURK|nr:hypothetical protein AWB79_02793 [Caballeronia hypogeia]
MVRAAHTLADLMFLQNAIGKGSFLNHYPGESAVMEVVESLPSADCWARYAAVVDAEQTKFPTRKS